MQSPDGEWGRIRNGNWTGLMGLLTRNVSILDKRLVTNETSNIFSSRNICLHKCIVNDCAL